MMANFEFCRFCAHFGEFMAKNNFFAIFGYFLPYIGQNWAILSNSTPRVSLDDFLWYYHAYIHKIRYFFNIFCVFRLLGTNQIQNITG